MNQQTKALLRAQIPADPRSSGPWAYSAIYQWDQDAEHEGLASGDIDGDGNLDVLVAEMGRWGRHQANPGARMLLFRGNGRGEFDRELLAKGIGNHESRLAGLDGDVDVVLGDHPGDPNRVLIFENVDRGESWTPHVIDAGPRQVIDHHNGTRLVDIDADGDLDIVSIGWNNPTVWLYENLTFPE